jgi:uncharacterized protein (DUF488 family)
MTSIYDIYSIGHSTHSQEKFSGLLRLAGVNAIADVRSSPFSRYSPQFSQGELKHWLKQDDINYVFLGKELGGRPSDPALFSNGIADYEAMAHSTAFAHGLDRLITGAKRHRIAMMCSESDPLDCHRCLLVARCLGDRGIKVGHVLHTGEIVSHAHIESRLLELEGLAADDLFSSYPQRLVNAYRQRNMKVAFAEAQPPAYAG